MKRAIVALVAIATIGLAGCGGGSGKHIIGGTLSLNDTRFDRWVDGTPCSGDGGYADIVPGATVTVTNDSGRILGTGHLQDGKTTSHRCVFPFVVDDLPDAKFYSVEVSHRGRLPYSKADLDKAGWLISTSLGND